MDPECASDPFGYVHDWHERRVRTGFWHSFELPDGRLLEGASSLASQRLRIAQFPIPADLTGKRVLDIGTWDGWFAMEMERRGADVMAIDRWDNPRFHAIREVLGSRVDYRQLSVYDLDPARIGRFDIVLFMGVLYHLKHPILALERVASVANDMVAVESFVLQDRFRPGSGVEQQTLLEFYENDEFGGQFDNWVAPTAPCLLAFCRTAGFPRVELNHVHEYGAAVTCHRKWDAGPSSEAPTGKGLRILDAFNSENFGINFNSRSSDEYIGCSVADDGIELTRDTMRPEVGGFGTPPVHVAKQEGDWRINFKLPPGLLPGWHPIKISTPQGMSNTAEIAVDIPLIVDRVALLGMRDSTSGEVSRVSLQNGFFSAWFSGLPANADKNNVKVWLGGKRQETTFVGRPSAEGVTQCNVALGPTTPIGMQTYTLHCGRAEVSGTVEVTA